MSKSLSDICIATRGGWLAPAELRYIAEAAMANGDGKLTITSRHEVLLRSIRGAEQMRLEYHLSNLRISTSTQSDRPNVTTTRAVLGFGKQTTWLSQGVFDTLLDRLYDAPSLPVCIADPVQHHLPVMTGVVNLLASDVADHWRIALAFPDAERVAFVSGTVSSNYAPVAVRLIADLLADHRDASFAEHMRVVQSGLTRLLRPDGLANAAPHVDEPAVLGFVQSAETGERGLSLAGPVFPAAMLVDCCVLAMARNWSGVGMTAWGELFFRGIPEESIADIRRTLVRHRYRMDTASALRVMSMDASCADLARTLIQSDVGGLLATAGLPVAFVSGAAGFPDTPIVVQRAGEARGRRTRWNVGVRERFDARSGELEFMARDIREGTLPDILTEILLQFGGDHRAPEVGPLQSRQTLDTHACQACLTEYDATIGDVQSGLPPGIAFAALPSNWCCPVCDAPKATFVKSGLRPITRVSA